VISPPTITKSFRFSQQLLLINKNNNKNNKKFNNTSTKEGLHFYKERMIALS